MQKLSFFILLLWCFYYKGNAQNIIIKSGTFQAFEINNGRLWAWGYNAYGELGIGNTQNQSIPVTVGNDADWKQIYPGDVHTIAKKNNGSIWSWGYNNFGQLGLGYSGTTDQLIPIQIGNETNWDTLAAGIQHTLAIKNDGTLWAWGFNNNGQLGQGNTSSLYSPTQIGTDHDWKSISAGYYFSVAIKNDGTLWAWGDNSYGQLGQGYVSPSGQPSSQLTPIQIGTDHDWKSISAGYNYCLAIKNNGTLWAWGDNSTCQLGTGKTYPPGAALRDSLPQKVNNDTDWAQTAAAKSHSLGRKSNGSLYSWGFNSVGQLGLGYTNPYSNSQCTPIQVGNENNWIDISANGEESFAQKSNHTIYDWGSNQYGELGQGYTSPDKLSSPTQLNITSQAPLPVRILSFTAQSTGDEDILNWNTSNDAITSYFEIQRSVDGINFSSLAKVIVIQTNSSEIHYQYTCKQTMEGISFYRLKIVDIDTKAYYSQVIVLKRNTKTAELKIFSNPVNNMLQLQLKFSRTIGRVKVDIFDDLGRSVKSEMLASSNNNLSTSIDVSSLQTGIYIIKILGVDGVRFIKE